MTARVDAVIVACAISAGIHAALVPEHLEEARAAGTAFAVSAGVLVALAVALTRRPAARTLHAAALLTFAGLLVSYALAITTGIPLLHPEREPVEGLAVATKAIEAAGALAALHLLRPRTVPAARPSLIHPKGSTT